LALAGAMRPGRGRSRGNNAAWSSVARHSAAAAALLGDGRAGAKKESEQRRFSPERRDRPEHFFGRCWRTHARAWGAVGEGESSSRPDAGDLLLVELKDRMAAAEIFYPRSRAVLMAGMCAHWVARALARRELHIAWRHTTRFVATPALRIRSFRGERLFPPLSLARSRSARIVSWMADPSTATIPLFAGS